MVASLTSIDGNTNFSSVRRIGGLKLITHLITEGITMGMLDQVITQAGGNIDLAAIGANVGLSPEQVTQATGQLLPQIADPNVDNTQATNDVAASTGISASALSALVPALVAAASSGGAAGQSGGVLGSIMSGLGGAPERQGGIFGSITGMLDRDGDGNPLNDVMGMFGKK